jgi:hypothetical protein
MADDEFYVGYAAGMPPGVRRFVRRAVFAALAAAGLVAALAAAFQNPFAPSVFEYGEEREFIGWLREAPAPILVVPAPACTEFCATTSSWLLTRYGTKLGAAELVRGLDGRQVRLRGVLVYRGDQTLLDVVPGSIEVIGADAQASPAAPPAQITDLGVQTLTGEIVDSKCHFGVMRPGSGNTHRSCAARCISSGAPPLLWVRDADGHDLYLLLLGADGRTLGSEILPWVAEPVAITGEVLRYDGLLVLRAEPNTYRRL